MHAFLYFSFVCFVLHCTHGQDTVQQCDAGFSQETNANNKVFCIPECSVGSTSANCVDDKSNPCESKTCARNPNAICRWHPREPEYRFIDSRTLEEVDCDGKCDGMREPCNRCERCVVRDNTPGCTFDENAQNCDKKEDYCTPDRCVKGRCEANDRAHCLNDDQPFYAHCDTHFCLNSNRKKRDAMPDDVMVNMTMEMKDKMETEMKKMPGQMRDKMMDMGDVMEETMMKMMDGKNMTDAVMQMTVMEAKMKMMTVPMQMDVGLDEFNNMNHEEQDATTDDMTDGVNMMMDKIIEIMHIDPDAVEEIGELKAMAKSDLKSIVTMLVNDNALPKEDHEDLIENLMLNSYRILDKAIQLISDDLATENMTDDEIDQMIDTMMERIDELMPQLESEMQAELDLTKRIGDVLAAVTAEMMNELATKLSGLTMMEIEEITEEAIEELEEQSQHVTDKYVPSQVNLLSQEEIAVILLNIKNGIAEEKVKIVEDATQPVDESEDPEDA